MKEASIDGTGMMLARALKGAKGTGGAGGGGGGGGVKGVGGAGHAVGGFRSTDGADGGDLNLLIAMSGATAILTLMSVFFLAKHYHLWGRVRFRVAVARARRRTARAPALEGTSSEVVEVLPATPHSGQYTAKYMEQNEYHPAYFNIQFDPDENNSGFQISGSAVNRDGASSIVDGHATVQGVAWWEERGVGTNSLCMLSTGTFNFRTGTFGGSFLSNTGVCGDYVRFQAGDEEGQVYVPTR